MTGEGISLLAIMETVNYVPWLEQGIENYGSRA